MASSFSCQNLDLPDGKVSSSVKFVFSATSGRINGIEVFVSESGLARW